jgi:hypothetical protein
MLWKAWEVLRGKPTSAKLMVLGMRLLSIGGFMYILESVIGLSTEVSQIIVCLGLTASVFGMLTYLMAILKV